LLEQERQALARLEAKFQASRDRAFQGYRERGLTPGGGHSEAVIDYLRTQPPDFLSSADQQFLHHVDDFQAVQGERIQRQKREITLRDQAADQSLRRAASQFSPTGQRRKDVIWHARGIDASGQPYFDITPIEEDWSPWRNANSRQYPQTGPKMRVPAQEIDRYTDTPGALAAGFTQNPATGQWQPRDTYRDFRASRIGAAIELRPEHVRDLAYGMAAIVLTVGPGFAAYSAGGLRALLVYLSNEGVSHATGLPVGWKDLLDSPADFARVYRALQEFLEKRARDAGSGRIGIVPPLKAPRGPALPADAPRMHGGGLSSDASPRNVRGDHFDGDSTSQGNHTPRQTGGGEFGPEADRAYDVIRASQTDVDEIATATGIDVETVQKVKEHLFYKVHLLDRFVDLGEPAKWGRFDSDLHYAQAWERLRNGTFTPDDIQLFNHELVEARYMDEFGEGYNAAHNHAQSIYPTPTFDQP